MRRNALSEGILLQIDCPDADKLGRLRGVRHRVCEVFKDSFEQLDRAVALQRVERLPPIRPRVGVSPLPHRIPRNVPRLGHRVQIDAVVHPSAGRARAPRPLLSLLRVEPRRREHQNRMVLRLVERQPALVVLHLEKVRQCWCCLRICRSHFGGIVVLPNGIHADFELPTRQPFSITRTVC